MSIAIVAPIILKLLPVIGNAVRAVEELEQSNGKGPAKLQVVIGIVRSIYEAAEPEAAVKFDALIATVTTVVGSLVNFYNAIGLFRKVSPQS